MDNALLRGILATLGRQTFPPSELIKLIAPGAGGAKQLLAFNLCDGTTPQAEIAQKSKLDRGNLSRSIARWVEIGIVIRMGAEQHPLHIYPLSKEALKGSTGAK